MPPSPTATAARVRRRAWWGDSLEAAVWLASAGAVAFFVASGGLLSVRPVDYVYSAGRIAGLIAAVLVMTQVLLVSRAPWVERVVGHDRATRLHTRLGKVAFILILSHAAIITVMTAYYDNHALTDMPPVFASMGWFMAAALMSLGLFTVVVATSLAAVRGRWRYERWHRTHLLVYVAIALAVPHQFLEGTTVRTQEAAFWYWAGLYALSFGSLLAFRVIRPLWRVARYDLRVREVRPLPDGSHSIVMAGRDLRRWKARPGQFFLWRFLDRNRWAHPHPFSLSAAPTDTELRITVRGSGDFTSDLGSLRAGTRVVAEGPLGVFSRAARTKPAVVLVGAGIGVAPLLAMLEEVEPSEACTVIVRVSSDQDAPLLEEISEAAARVGATVHVLAGPRGAGWLPQGSAAMLKQLAPHLTEADVYICGPQAWARSVEHHALASGCHQESIHREEFAW